MSSFSNVDPAAVALMQDHVCKTMGSGESVDLAVVITTRDTSIDVAATSTTHEVDSTEFAAVASELFGVPMRDIEVLAQSDLSAATVTFAMNTMIKQYMRHTQYVRTAAFLCILLLGILAVFGLGYHRTVL